MRILRIVNANGSCFYLFGQLTVFFFHSKEKKTTGICVFDQKKKKKKLAL
jgi:hypothetical protein